jgi:hypothetical protein
MTHTKKVGGGGRTCPQRVGMAQQSPIVLATLLLLVGRAAAAAVGLAADVRVDLVDVDVALLGHGDVQPAVKGAARQAAHCFVVDGCDLLCMSGVG